MKETKKETDQGMSASQEEQVDVGTASVDQRASRRNRAAVRTRHSEALRMALQGLSFDVIAQELGYANRGAAWKAAQACLERQTSASVDELRDLELARLDTLQAAYWTQATDGGSIRATELILKISGQRIKLLGMEAPNRPSSVTEPHTIVIPSEPGAYIEALRAVADRKGSPTA